MSLGRSAFRSVRRHCWGLKFSSGEPLDLVLAREWDGLSPATNRLPLNSKCSREFGRSPEVLDGVAGFHGRRL